MQPPRPPPRAATRAAARAAASSRTAPPAPWRQQFIARCLTRVKANRAAVIDARRLGRGRGGVATAPDSGRHDGGDGGGGGGGGSGSGVEGMAAEALTPPPWAGWPQPLPPSSPIASPVKAVPPRPQGLTVLAVPFGRHGDRGAGGDDALTRTTPAAGGATSVDDAMAVTAGGGPAPFGGPRGPPPPSAGVRAEVVATAASEGWLDVADAELEVILAEVEVALAEEAAAEEAARLDAYLSTDGGGGRPAASGVAMDGVHVGEIGRAHV